MSEPFGAAPDPGLGALLREGLDEGHDHAATLARLRASLAVAPREEDDGLAVLARWAAPGLAVAATLLLTVGLWLAVSMGAGEPAVAAGDALGVEPGATEVVYVAVPETR